MLISRPAKLTRKNVDMVAVANLKMLRLYGWIIAI